MHPRYHLATTARVLRTTPAVSPRLCVLYNLSHEFTLVCLVQSQPYVDACVFCKVVSGRVLYPSTRGYLPGHLPDSARG